MNPDFKEYLETIDNLDALGDSYPEELLQMGWMAGRRSLAECRCWLIWSNEHEGWWGKRRCGYYTQVDSAGRYTLQEALDRCGYRSRTTGQPDELVQPSPELLAMLGIRLKQIKEVLPGQPPKKPVVTPI